MINQQIWTFEARLRGEISQSETKRYRLKVVGVHFGHTFSPKKGGGGGFGSPCLGPSVRLLRHTFFRCTVQLIDQFWYIKIQPKTIGLSTRLWVITTEFVGFIPQSVVLRSIVLDWILIYRNWSIGYCYNESPNKKWPVMLRLFILCNSFVFQPSLSFQTMRTSITPWTQTWNLCYLNSRKRRAKVPAEVCLILVSSAVAPGAFPLFPCFVCFISFFISHTLIPNSGFFSLA